MAKMKQGYNSRLDESLGMRRGAEKSKMQSYKDRRDESRAMRSNARSENEKYMPKGMGSKIMRHEKSPMKIDAPECQGWKEVKPFRPGNLGYPRQAFDYKY